MTNWYAHSVFAWIYTLSIFPWYAFSQWSQLRCNTGPPSGARGHLFNTSTIDHVGLLFRRFADITFQEGCVFICSNFWTYMISVTVYDWVCLSKKKNFRAELVLFTCFLRRGGGVFCLLKLLIVYELLWLCTIRVWQWGDRKKSDWTLLI